MADLAATRRSLHGVAELLLAGPQHVRSQTIRLAPCEGGFRTTREPAVSVVGGALVHDGRAVPIDGRSIAVLAEAVGLTHCSLDDLYRDSTGISPDEVLVVEEEAAAQVAAAFAQGAEALSATFPSETPVLWPEHFLDDFNGVLDVGCGDRVR